MRLKFFNPPPGGEEKFASRIDPDERSEIGSPVKFPVPWDGNRVQSLPWGSYLDLSFNYLNIRIITTQVPKMLSIK